MIFRKYIDKQNEQDKSHNEQAGLSILNISEIVIYEYWYDYGKAKYGDHARACCTYKDSFI